MKLQFVGSGDAFGTDGRFNTCFHLTGETVNCLIDCGASSLVALKKQGIACNDISTIFITHFHGDHFGGVAFFILDAQLSSKRLAPLTIAGPAGLKAAYERNLEANFPGSSGVQRKFDVTLIELEPGKTTAVNGIAVTPQLAAHGNPGGPCLALRLEAEGKTVAYTGDTEWTDTLIDAARGADLFIAEGYVYERAIQKHLTYLTLASRLPEIGARRLILTHMSADMLARRSDLPCETADDGLVVTF